jgi:hypothetical protein
MYVHVVVIARRFRHMAYFISKRFELAARTGNQAQTAQSKRPHHIFEFSAASDLTCLISGWSHCSHSFIIPTMFKLIIPMHTHAA